MSQPKPMMMIQDRGYAIGMRQVTVDRSVVSELVKEPSVDGSKGSPPTDSAGRWRQLRNPANLN